MFRIIKNFEDNFEWLTVALDKDVHNSEKKTIQHL